MEVKEKNVSVLPDAAVKDVETVQPIYIPKKPVYNLIKRAFDIVVSFLGIVVLFIPILIIMLIVVIDSPGKSPLYVQKRVGKNGKIFDFYKIRSMVPDAENMLDSLLERNEMEGACFKIKDDPRITRVGKFLRKTSIDELPQLINVLKGDMSLVGPRPPLPREVELYNNYQLQRLNVMPGITCYWQMQPSRNDLSFDEWVDLDIKYINERSVKTDVKVLVKTVRAVCGLEGQ